MNEKDSILVIDTAMHGCGVAVLGESSNVSCSSYSDDPQGQAQVLVPMVQDVLDQAGITFKDLSDVVVCNGPGTFTGIRIGLSAAKTFGLTLNIPVWGISSLQAMSFSVDSLEGDMLVIVETRRQDFYVQRFNKKGMAIDEAASRMAGEIEVGDYILLGNAVERFDPNGVYSRANITRIDVEAVGRAFKNDRLLFTQDVEPIYLRSPDVSQPKNKPRRISSK